MQHLLRSLSKQQRRSATLSSEEECNASAKPFASVLHLTATACVPSNEPSVPNSTTVIRTIESKSAWSAVFKVGGVPCVGTCRDAVPPATPLAIVVYFLLGGHGEGIKGLEKRCGGVVVDVVLILGNHMMRLYGHTDAFWPSHRALHANQWRLKSFLQTMQRPIGTRSRRSLARYAGAQ